MIGIILGFALGAMAFTETGREIGNRAASLAVEQSKKALKKPEAEALNEKSTN